MKLAIFDIDVTLTATNDVDDVCFVQAQADAHGISGINTDWASHTHTTDSAITSQIYQERFAREPELVELQKIRSVSCGCWTIIGKSVPVCFVKFLAPSQC
jgi:hypothetical protein